MGLEVNTVATPGAAQSEQQQTLSAPRGRMALVRGRLLESLVPAWPYVGAAAIAFGVALWTYQPWLFGNAVTVPTGDGASFHHHIQNVLDTGWYELGDRIGAPFGSNGHAYPNTDELSFFLIGNVLASLMGSAAAGVTWWVIVGFPLSAVVAVSTARYMGVSRVASLVPGVGFALLPEHFLRPAFGHFLLGSIWAAGLGLLVALTLVGPRPDKRSQRLWLEATMIGACVVIALSVNYYAVFTGVLVAAAGVGGALAARDPAVLWRAAARGVALVVPITIALYSDSKKSPPLQGYGPLDPTRSPAESEIYAGKITAALLPTNQHRLEILRNFRIEYDSEFPNPAEHPALGTVSAVGLIGLLCWSVVRLWSRRGPSSTDERLGILAGFAWVSLIMFAVGGLGTAWALFVGEGIRAWSRAHILLALLALLAVGVVLDRAKSRWVAATAATALVILVLFDQTSPLWRPDLARAQDVEREVTALTGKIAGLVGPSAMIYQLPQRDLPAPNDATAIYDSFLPYLYSDSLRWSYGGWQGDPSADWQSDLDQRPLPEQYRLLAASGFSGILVDTAAVQDSAELMQQVSAALGPPVVSSENMRWQFFRLEPPACGPQAQTELADAATRPPILYPGEGFIIGRGRSGTAEGDDSTLELITLRDQGWGAATVTLTLDSANSTLVVTWPDGRRDEVTPGETLLRWTGSIEPGRTTIPINRTEGEGGYSVETFPVEVKTSQGANECVL